MVTVYFQVLTQLKELLMSIRLNDLLVRSDGLGNLSVLQAGVPGLGNLQLAFVESSSLNLPLNLEGSDNVLVLPPDLKHKMLKSTP